MISATESTPHIFLRDIEDHPQPSPYADAIAAAKSSGEEYWGIWSLLAFRPRAAHHLAALSHEIMFAEAPISPGMRELIAAYTSSLNQCEFCMRAHTAVAAHTLGEELVLSVLKDPESSALAEKDKALFRLVHKLTLNSGSVGEADIAALHSAGWDDVSIFYAIDVCALFNFYNRFVSGNGVRLISGAAFRRLGARMATQGYLR